MKIIYVITITMSTILKPVLLQRMYKYDLSCYNIKQQKDLPPITKYSFKEAKKIFFLETSCSGVLDSRQACTVESAARSNPDWNIYVLFLGPADKNFIIGETFSTLNDMHNVYFGRIFLEDFAQKSLMRKVFGVIRRASGWPLHHMADALKLMILARYGGVYLDLDMMVVRSLNPLGKHWVAKETDRLPGSSAISISKDPMGDYFSKLAIQQFVNNYSPHGWKYNGPFLILTVLRKICEMRSFNEMSKEKCHGINIYPVKYFFPKNVTEWSSLFSSNENLNLKQSYGVHFWSKFSKDAIVLQNSTYSHLAEKYCNSIFSLYLNYFGTRMIL